MRPSISIINGGEKHLGLARKKLAALEQWRRQFGQLTAKHPPIHTGDALILLRCSEWDQRITIIGLFSPGNILLAANIDGEAVFSVYDYISDKVSTATKIPGLVVQDPLSPAFNHRCQLGDFAHATFSNSSWSGDIIGNAGRVYLGGVAAYEAAYFAEGNQIYERIGEQASLAATVSAGNVMLPDFCGPTLNLFGLAAYPTSSFWNLYQGASVFTLTPNTGRVNESGAWVPSFFVVEPGDYYGLKPGWYYGAYPGSVYSMDDPLTSLKVSLSGVLETRFPGGMTQRGWCETVTEVDGEEKGDIFFHLDQIPMPGNGYAYRELVTGSYSESFITIGSELQGRAAEFSLETTRPGEKPDAVEMWNFRAWTAENSFPITDGIGVFIIEGRKLRGYRYRGYTAKFIETDSFHSYAVSDDGSMVAVFEAEDGGLISRVRVFDLYGERVVAQTQEPDYLHGGFTEIVSSEVVAPLTALTACFIPMRDKDFETKTVIHPIASPGQAISSTRDYFPSLSTLRFVKSANHGLSIAKVICENGIDAEFGVSHDPCFESVVVVDDPDQETATDRLISKWDAGGVVKGVVRGEFSGNHPGMRFKGIGKGSSGWYGIVTLNKTLWIVQHTDGTFSIENVAGEIVSTSCLTEDMKFDPSCMPDCGGNAKITAESSCGQSGEYAVEVGLSPLFISGPDTFGGQFSAHGGRPPYRFSSSCGSINEDSGEVIDFSGCCGEIVVTVEDSCSQSASMPVRGSTGTWNTTSVTKADTEGIYTCTSQYANPRDRWKGFCDISSCYCGSQPYYLSATSRFVTCAMPGWGPGMLIDDCSRAYCYVVKSQFQCTSVPHVNNC